MKNKTMRRAMISSIVALALCFAMLLGTTYAWFTDQAASTNNIIKSGKLDMVLQYMPDPTADPADDASWAEVTAQTKLFDDTNALYEPGYTQVAYVRIKNVGTLAFKYNLTANIASETEGVNVFGDNFKLSSYLKFGTANGQIFANRADAIAAVDATAGTLSVAASGAVANDVKLLPGATTDIIALVIYMPTTVGNEANYGTTQPSITLGVTALATQAVEEVDSFGNDYDALAEYPAAAVASANAAATALAAGQDVTLSTDIAATNNIAVNGSTVDGNGNDVTFGNTGADCLFTTTSGTIKNVTITGNGNGRAIGAGSGGTTKQTGDLYIENVTIDNVLYAINGNGATGNEKVIVSNSTIYGWSSYANVAEFSFTDCHLGKGNCGYGVLCTYGDTTLNNCAIDDTLVLYARNPGSDGHTITINNCTYGVAATPVTADNFASLFLDMSDSDCVYITTNMTVIVDGVQVQFN